MTDTVYQSTAMLTYISEMEQNLIDAQIAAGQGQIILSREAAAGLQALHSMLAHNLRLAGEKQESAE